MGDGYEIDFIPVGNGDKSGDAIAIRYGSEGNFRVIVIDGGTKESGGALVNHIRQYYKTDFVDYVVNTHPDGDHTSGLSVVLEELQVGELWIHRPWKYSAKIKDLFKDGRITSNSLSERLKDDLISAYVLEEIAERKNITIKEPFAGSQIGDFIVLSPSRKWYLELVPHFDKTPEAKVPEQSLTSRAFQKLASWIDEEWDIETLSESGDTSAENESSVILYGNIGNKGILLTGDAGIMALTNAADYADSIDIDLIACSFVQIPHHGSRHNVSPSVLNRIVGTKKEKGTEPIKTAFVSVSENSTKHPRKVVINAFLRRGAKVIATQGIIKCNYYNFPSRPGWSTAVPLPFCYQVEGE